MRPEEYSVQYKCPPGCVKFFHAVLHDEGQVNFNKMIVCTYDRPFFFILEVPGLVRPGQVFNSLWGHRPKLQGFPSYWGTVDPTDATEC